MKRSATRFSTGALDVWASMALACAMVVVASAHMAQAGSNVWTTAGPNGQSVDALAIDPSTPSTLYAGTYYGGVFKSTNGGGSWGAVNTGLPSYQQSIAVYALAINPTTSTVYAGTPAGVYQSTNRGGSWSLITPDLSTLPVRALGINPKTPSTLYAGTELEGVFKSTNSGGSWSDASDGLTGPFAFHISSLAINPTTPSTLYAGTAGSGIYKSTNSGGSWSAANFLLLGNALYVSAVAIDPTTPSTLYIGTNLGVLRSTNSGGSWSQGTGLSGDALLVQSLAIDPSTPSTLYAGTDGEGVFRSTNSGDSWSAFNNGLTTLSGVRALALAPTTPRTLYAGAEGGVSDIEIVSTTQLSPYIWMDPGCLENGDNVVFTVGESISANVRVDSGSVSQVDATVVELLADGGTSFIDSGTIGTNRRYSTASWTVGPPAGVHTVQLTATAGSLSVTDTCSFHVQAKGSTPTKTPTPTKTATSTKTPTTTPTSTPTPTPVSWTRAQLNALAQRFRPFLKFSRDEACSSGCDTEDERYRPSDWQSFVEDSDLWYAYGVAANPWVSREEGTLAADPNSLITFNDPHATLVTDVRHSTADQNLQLVPAHKGGETWQEVEGGDGIYAHVEPINDDLVNIEYITLYRYNRGTNTTSCSIGADILGEVTDHWGDLTFLTLVYSQTCHQIIRATFAPHGLIILAYDLIHPSYVHTVTMTGESTSPCAGSVCGAVTAKQVGVSSNSSYENGPSYAGGVQPLYVGCQKTVDSFILPDPRVYFVQDPSSGYFEHIAVFIEWGSHEIYPAECGETFCTPTHTGSGPSFLPRQVTYLGPMSDMYDPAYAHAPFIFFNGTWGNDPQPPIMHNEWYYPNGRGNITCVNPITHETYPCQIRDRFRDRDPYAIPDLPWPPVVPVVTQCAAALQGPSPTARCQNVEVPTGGNCPAQASIDNGSTCPGSASCLLSQNPPGPYPLGSTPVTLTATDDVGATGQCTATVTVVDSYRPIIVVPPPVTVSTGPGATKCAAVVSDATLGTATAHDICGGAATVVRSGVPAGNIFPVGSSSINYLATDVNGINGSQIQSVTVVDNTPPSLTVPPAVTVSTAPGATTCAAVVSDAVLGTATATDNCPGVRITRSGVPPGNVFSVGGSVISYEAADASGITVNAAQTVTVNGDPECPGSRVCGGIAGLPCRSGEVCNLRDSTCAIVDLAGVCAKRPGNCIALVDPVCGCDGKTYSSDCWRLMADVTLAHAGACGTTTSTPTRTPTFRPTLATPTPIGTKTPTPRSTPPPCVGDCNGSSEVVVSEIVTLVNIALGNANTSSCPRGIPTGLNVDISLIVRAVNNLLTGCSS